MTQMTMTGRIPTAGPGHRWRWITLTVLCVTLLLVSLDNTILNVALPSIVGSMHATSSQLQWIVDAYAIVFAGLLLPLGALGNRVGRKWVYMAGLAVFGGGSGPGGLVRQPGPAHYRPRPRASARRRSCPAPCRS